MTQQRPEFIDGHVGVSEVGGEGVAQAVHQGTGMLIARVAKESLWRV